MEGFLFENWAKTFRCQPELYFEPADRLELVQIVNRAREEGKRVKVHGFGHSPSDIACTSGYMINMRHLTKVLQVDVNKHQIKVEAAVQLKTLNEQILPKHGLALKVLGAISEQTVAGAISTGTHGTGFNQGIIATDILELELLTSDGEIITCSEKDNPDIYNGACCGLGALGIIVAVTIQCEPAYRLHEIQTSTTLDDVLDNLDAYVEGNEHFRFHWYPHTNWVMISRANRTQKQVFGNAGSWFWDKLVGYHAFQFGLWLSKFWEPLVPLLNRLHFLVFASFPKERVDIHHKIFNFDCLFKQYVTEWAIPRDKTPEVLRELQHFYDSGSFYAHMPTEVRFVKKDDIMISPANGRETCFINIIQFRPYGLGALNTRYWGVYEDIVRRAGGRPHWAKAHPLKSTDFAQCYPRWSEFSQLRQRLDPRGMFLNTYLERIFSD